jgi:hypothetical protein
MEEEFGAEEERRSRLTLEEMMAENGQECNACNWLRAGSFCSGIV